jgi:hypothetical protein
MVQHWEGRMSLPECAGKALEKMSPFYGVTDTQADGKGNCVAMSKLPPASQKTNDAECRQTGWTKDTCAGGVSWRIALYKTEPDVKNCAAAYVGCSVDKKGLHTKWLGPKLLHECQAAAFNRKLPYYGVTAGNHATGKVNCIAWATPPTLTAPDSECREMMWSFYSCPLGWTWRIAVYKTTAPFQVETTTTLAPVLYDVGTRTTTPWITVTTTPFKGVAKYESSYKGVASQHVAAWPQVGLLFTTCLLLTSAIVIGLVIRGVRRHRIEVYSPMGEEDSLY